MKKYLIIIISLLFIPFNIYAEEAHNISDNSIYKIDNDLISELKDNSYDTFIDINKNSILSIKSTSNIKYIYITYEYKSGKGTLTTNNETQELGKEEFLHEYHRLNNPTKNIKLQYNEKVIISEVKVYSEGSKPDEIQTWTREKTADLMIFSTHADDEVLFFAGIMPTYLDRGKKVHVVYLARHDVGKHTNPKRLHEQLDGLWTLGIKDYPTFGIVPDQYSKIKEYTPKGKKEILETVEKQLEENKITDDDIITFYTNEILKYKPKVIVGHDEYGEYGHGQHVLNTYILKKTINKLNNTDYKVNKVYLHLYDLNNSTVIDFDIPLKKYEGQTAYQMAQRAFSKHVTQQKSKYPQWLNGANNDYTTAKEIQNYNPMYWGLYYTNVGKDEKKNDLFEHIPEDMNEIDNDEAFDNEIIDETIHDDRHLYYLLINIIIIILISVIFIVILIIIIKHNKRR